MQPGDVLLEKYRIEEVLGTGGMGKVVRASHLFLQQQFAIKVLLPHMADSAETVSRFLREAQATSKLKSEHIARVFDVGRMADGAPFMVMEYLQGNDLNQILRHHGPQRPNIVCDLMLQACEGMAEAHAFGVVHRDIKPSNFFITTKPDGTMLLKILDFGISKTPVGVTELTGASTVIGTPTYMSPEQMRSGRDADARSDVWSLGIVMYQLLDGRPPFVGESYAELVLKVGSELPQPISTPLPPGLMQVIMTCLEKNPTQRQQSVAELARMLAPYVSDPVQGAHAAQRTARILANRAGAKIDSLPVTAGGGLAPLSPSQLTPSSRGGWPPNPSGNSSLSHSRGQITHTHHVGGSLRWGRISIVLFVFAALIGGVIVVATGALSSDNSDGTAHVLAPPSEPAVVAPEAKAAVTTTPEPKVPEIPAQTEPAQTKSVETKSVETKPLETKPLETKPLETKLESEVPRARDLTTPAGEPEVAATKPATKPETKPSVTKPTTTVKTETKPATKPVVKKRPKKNDELFNTRH